MSAAASHETDESANSRYAHLRRALGAKVFDAVQQTPVLVIGAGGIGCELLKNLVLSGFRNIETIDLDTIDVSNLNRQFLFRKKHVGQPKALVAREAALAFNPDTSIVAHHGNVKSAEFGLDYFKRFGLVLNALDNVGARQHVNRLCLAADVPLIDGGTTGYLGQVAVILKGETKCYDCEPKTDGVKVYPICTIRNTPDKPVHCIEWAKHLFILMFGHMEDSQLYDALDSDSAAAAAETQPSSAVGAEALAKDKQVRTVIMDAVRRPSSAPEMEPPQLEAYAKRVFDAVFDNEIRVKLSMKADAYKGAKHRPVPLSVTAAETAGAEEEEAERQRQENSAAASQTPMLPEQRVWSLKRCVEIFVQCVVAMWTDETKRATIGEAIFDKDDEVALDFVTAAANLRSHVFSIERKSRFDVKGIAGNIIHAIATTNAIVAGLQVLQGINIVRKVFLVCWAKLGRWRRVEIRANALEVDGDEGVQEGNALVKEAGDTVSIAHETGMPLYLGRPRGCRKWLPFAAHEARASREELRHLWQKPAPSDYLHKDCDVWRSRHQGMGFNFPEVRWTCDGADGSYEEGDDLDEDEVADNAARLPKVLSEPSSYGWVPIKHGTILSITDFSQDVKCEIIVHHREMPPPEAQAEDLAADAWLKANPSRFSLEGELTSTQTAESGENGDAMGSAPTANDGEDDIEIVECEPSTVSGTKRSRTENEPEIAPPSAKRAKGTSASDVIELF